MNLMITKDDESVGFVRMPIIISASVPLDYMPDDDAIDVAMEKAKMSLMDTLVQNGCLKCGLKFHESGERELVVSVKVVE